MKNPIEVYPIMQFDAFNERMLWFVGYWAGPIFHKISAEPFFTEREAKAWLKEAKARAPLEISLQT